jgi:5-(carboxyamino)imidazole ribonucleotide mutase
MSDSLSVSIFMGSKSDIPIVQAASDTLKDFGISHKMFILSAHRTPEEVVKRVKESEANGVKVFIAAAGMAAHLAGAIAAQTKKTSFRYSLRRR